MIKIQKAPRGMRNLRAIKDRLFEVIDLENGIGTVLVSPSIDFWELQQAIERDENTFNLVLGSYSDVEMEFAIDPLN